MPEDKELEESVPFWKGRIPTIKEDVKDIVAESQNQMSQKTNAMFEILMKEIKGFKDDINGLKEKVSTLEQRVNEQNSSRFFY